MVERPILFSAPMVRAILAGQKTQTRRLVKRSGLCVLDLKTGEEVHGVTPVKCPYGKPGDRLWVREKWCPVYHGSYEPLARTMVIPDSVHSAFIQYGEEYRFGGSDYDGFWRPSIHMPRWASRITLEITGVRVERLQDISEADARAEGAVVEMVENEFGVWVKSIDGKLYPNAVQAFGVAVWSSIHAADGPNGLAANPWVWVVQFERLEKEAV